MRLLSVVLLVTTICIGTSWWWLTIDTCPVPITYRLGEVDERFAITAEEAKARIKSATAVWEESTSRNLFVYDESSDFTIDFVFDERQDRANAEESTRAELDIEQEKNEKLRAQIASIQAEYETLSAAFSEKKSAYEAELSEYNDTVRQYNDRGGAPSDVHDELEQQKNRLSATAQSLSVTASQLNTMADQLNQLGAEGNRRVAAYNEEVEDYNARYGYIGEFTQGDYQGEDIHIYKFSTPEELQRVLVHEFGHALGLTHVEATSAVMYYLMEEPAPAPVLTDADLAAFAEQCGSKSGLRSHIRTWLIEWL